jgi:hypothetical protein
MQFVCVCVHLFFSLFFFLSKYSSSVYLILEVPHRLVTWIEDSLCALFQFAMAKRERSHRTVDTCEIFVLSFLTDDDDYVGCLVGLLSVGRWLG